MDTPKASRKQKFHFKMCRGSYETNKPASSRLSGIALRMDVMNRLFVVVVLSLLAAGCTDFESARTASAAAADMSDILGEQIVDNLIRLRNGMPIVHYDVQQIQAQIQQNLNPQITAGRTNVTNQLNPSGKTTTRNGLNAVTGVSKVVGVADAALGSVTRPFGFSIQGTRGNSNTVVLNPVTKEPDVYFAYTEFLNAPKWLYDAPSNTWYRQWEKANPTPECSSNGGRATPTPTPTPAPKTKLSTKDTESETTVTKDPQNNPVSSVEKTITKTTEVPADMPTAPKPTVSVYFKNIDYTPKVRSLSSLEKTLNPPAKGDYIPHTLKKEGGYYYWVPQRFMQDYSDLCLAVVARGTLVATQSKYGRPCPRGGGNVGTAIIVAPGNSDVEKQLNLQNLELNNLNSTIRSLVP